jgi:hypothetical protein
VIEPDRFLESEDRKDAEYEQRDDFLDRFEFRGRTDLMAPRPQITTAIKRVRGNLFTICEYF